MDKYAVFPFVKDKFGVSVSFGKPRFKQSSYFFQNLQINPDSIRMADRANEQVTVYGQEGKRKLTRLFKLRKM